MHAKPTSDSHVWATLKFISDARAAFDAHVSLFQRVSHRLFAKQLARHARVDGLNDPRVACQPTMTTCFTVFHRLHTTIRRAVRARAQNGVVTRIRRARRLALLGVEIYMGKQYNSISSRDGDFHRDSKSRW
jgi:hypothetical protein